MRAEYTVKLIDRGRFIGGVAAGLVMALMQASAEVGTDTMRVVP